MAKQTPDQKKLAEERIRRCNQKIKDNIADFASGNSKEDGSEITAKDLNGHHKVYDLALRKILKAEA